MNEPDHSTDEPDYIETDLGPDERDRDLLDGTWEEDYYAGRVRTRDWQSVMVGVSLLLLAAIFLGMFAVFR